MADDGDDWFASADDDAPRELKPIGKKAAEEAPPQEAAPAAGEAAPAEGEAPPEEEQKPEAEEEFLDPDKLILFKHWIRPKFLPYTYLYLYRQNYYDDVMDYLDKRSRGVSREIPRAQTWAERVLRTFSNKVTKYKSCTKRFQHDLDLVEKTKASGKFFSYHVKEIFNRQFSPLLY